MQPLHVKGRGCETRHGCTAGKGVFREGTLRAPLPTLVKLSSYNHHNASHHTLPFQDKSISFSCPPGPEVLEGKTLGIFFWSHTCDICEGFAKALAGFYRAWVAKGLDNFEIIAVTDVADDADDDEMAMWAAFQNHGDWYSVPFDAEDVRHRANDWAADILGDSPSGAGPSLIIVSPDGRVVNQRAMLQLASGVDNILQHTWAPPAVGNLAYGAYSGGADIGTSKALVVLTEACSKKVQEKVAGVLEEVAPGLTRRGILTLHGSKLGAAAGVRPDVLAALGGGCEAWGRGWTARAIRKWAAAANDRCKTPQTYVDSHPPGKKGTPQAPPEYSDSTQLPSTPHHPNTASRSCCLSTHPSSPTPTPAASMCQTSR